MLRKETTFLDKAWASCFWNSQKCHLITDQQKIYPKSEFKVDTKNHEKKKAILILQRVNFCFQNTRQRKDYYIEWHVLGLWPKSLIFKRFFSKTNISLISFQQLDLNRHDLWSIRFDSRIRKIVEQRRTLIESAESLTWNDINSSQHSLKSWDTLGQYSGPWEENKQYSAQLGGQRKMIKWRIGERETICFKER
jgi:hypothetical protein